MNGLFSAVINMSLGGTFLIIAAIIIRTLFRKMPGAFMCCIWGLVFINLVCPFSIKIPYQSDLAIFPGQNISAEYTAGDREVAETPVADGTSSKTEPVVSAEDVFQPSGYLWQWLLLL